MRKSPQMQAIESRFGRPLEELIREQVEAGVRQDEIAKYLGVSYWTLRSWLYRLGAEFVTSVRFYSEHKHAKTP